MTQIVYRYFGMGDLVAAAMKELRDNSPVGSIGDLHPGLYRDSHTLFVDGHVAKDLSGWKPGSQINISNPVPYARKIEVGKMKLSVPNHVYETAAQVLTGRFGNIAIVKFTFMPVRFGDIQIYAAFSKQLKAGRRRMSDKARQDWLVRQPSLEIRVR